MCRGVLGAMDGRARWPRLLTGPVVLAVAFVAPRVVPMEWLSLVMTVSLAAAWCAVFVSYFKRRRRAA